jgi:hypothetical protein
VKGKDKEVVKKKVSSQQRKPTARQIKAMELMVENGGIISKAMRDAGYSAETAKSPSKLTDSIVFRSLAEKMDLRPALREESLMQNLEEGLAAWKRVGSPTEPDSIDPDFSVRHKWWTSAATLRGWMKDQGDTNIQINVTPIHSLEAE